MTIALLSTTAGWLLAIVLMVAVGLLLSRAVGGGVRFRSRDVAQPSPNRDGDALRRSDQAGPDELTPRDEHATPERQLPY